MIIINFKILPFLYTYGQLILNNEFVLKEFIDIINSIFKGFIMNELQSTLRMVNKLIDWQQNTCHFFYVTEELESMTKKDLKQSFNNFISTNYSNSQFESIDSISEKIKDLSYFDKITYFKPENIYVVDCLNINKDNIHIYNSLYDLTKNEKTALIYYTSPEILRDYLMQSEQYQFRASTIENIDHILHKVFEYNQLKDEIAETKQSNASTKKPKL